MRGLNRHPAKMLADESWPAGSNPAYSAKYWYFKSRPSTVWFIDLITWKAYKCIPQPGGILPDCNTVRAMNKISSIV